MQNPMIETAKAITRKRFTTQYPEEKESLPDSYRGMLKLDMDTCISCAACERICPNQTITMVEAETDKGIKKFPQIGIDRCLFCALCEEVCPPKCLTLGKETEVFVAYDKRSLIKRPEELE